MKFVILGKSGCSYCLRAKKLCKDAGVNYTYLSLDKNSKALLEILFEFEIKTVPVIFEVTDECTRYIGGYEELHNYLKFQRGFL